MVVGGSINAPSGYIEISGERIEIGDEARIDVSHLSKPGQINIGGGLHGIDPGIQNAELTVIRPGAEIFADCLEKGTGGQVVIWSDGITSHTGFISARGKEGDGGFCEISGAEGLHMHYLENSLNTHGAVIDLRGAKDGQLLLDPKKCNHRIRRDRLRFSS